MIGRHEMPKPQGSRACQGESVSSYFIKIYCVNSTMNFYISMWHYMDDGRCLDTEPASMQKQNPASLKSRNRVLTVRPWQALY